MFELLVVLAISGVALASISTFYVGQMRNLRQNTLRVEVQQAMRASLDAISRDLRLAGACLPAGGAYLPLSGTNVAAGDTITIRTGVVNANNTCFPTSVANNPSVLAGATAITLINGAGFTPDMLVYIRHPNGAGELKNITNVAGNVITVNSGLSQDYPFGSGAWPVDERVYALDKSGATPLLTLNIGQNGAQAFAAGIGDMQFRYQLNRNCPPCDVVDLPADTAEWSLVNSVNVTVKAQTVGPKLANDAFAMTTGIDVKPRNLLP